MGVAGPAHLPPPRSDHQSVLHSWPSIGIKVWPKVWAIMGSKWRQSSPSFLMVSFLIMTIFKHETQWSTKVRLVCVFPLQVWQSFTMICQKKILKCRSEIDLIGICGKPFKKMPRCITLDGSLNRKLSYYFGTNSVESNKHKQWGN